MRRKRVEWFDEMFSIFSSFFMEFFLSAQKNWILWENWKSNRKSLLLEKHYPSYDFYPWSDLSLKNSNRKSQPITYNFSSFSSKLLVFSIIFQLVYQTVCFTHSNEILFTLSSFWVLQKRRKGKRNHNFYIFVFWLFRTWENKTFTC